ncbi:Hydroxypyruvate reductase isoform B [Glycine soja]|uniref:Hydroxypyruvate reductase isoform B n=2 Tax=Glycine soja TaxID=3848 RepID=A0A445KYQ7_GLYSO|nr:Hydroxypyruvate reductase isoform B [Glycine soja]
MLRGLFVFGGTCCRRLTLARQSTQKQKQWWDHLHHHLRSKNLHWAGLMESNGNSVKDAEKQITRVLFCGPRFPASHEYTIEYLQNHSHIKVDVLPLEDVPKDIANYHVCIVKNMRLDSEIISRAVQMQLIMQYGVGLEGVDIDAATKHGIKVARIPGDVSGNSASCAEMAIYLMLGLLRKQNELQVSIQQKKLGEPITETLLGKTIFILGFGNIGMDLAKRLQPFGVKVIATKRSWASYAQHASKLSRNDAEDLVDVKGSHEDIYEFARKADIVVCCLTLNRETVGIINNKFISSMKKLVQGYLITYTFPPIYQLPPPPPPLPIQDGPCPQGQVEEKQSAFHQQVSRYLHGGVSLAI